MILKGRKVAKGTAEGDALVSREGISFYGGVDPETGIVGEKGHQLEGKSVSGKVLVFPTGKGSTVGSYVIYDMSKRGTAPAAIVNKEIETIIAVGAIISGVPCVDRIDIEKIKNGDRIRVDGDKGTVENV
ncbi:MAG: DUF126 domain-containing protein [Candidatus Aenigmarchaeota archaeon]|nr:DUF126 domain-containing protein [Candidatus Aenigmarchaeota archaeon]